MKAPSEKEVLEAIREGLSESEDAGTNYVPVQKLTIAIALKVMVEICNECKRSEKKCSKCVKNTAIKRLMWSIKEFSMFDKDFNLLPSPKMDETEKENGDK